MQGMCPTFRPETLPQGDSGAGSPRHRGLFTALPPPLTDTPSCRGNIPDSRTPGLPWRLLQPGEPRTSAQSPELPLAQPVPSAAASGKRCRTPRGEAAALRAPGPPAAPLPLPSRLSAGLKAGEAGPTTGKGSNTFLLPPQLFPLVAGVHGGVAGGGFELQVPQAHEGVEETPRQSRAIPTPRAAASAAAGTADPAGSGSAPAARCPSAGSRLALPRHPRSARPAPRRPLAPAAAAQRPPPPPPPPAPTRRSLSAAAPGRQALGGVCCEGTRGAGCLGATLRARRGAGARSPRGAGGKEGAGGHRCPVPPRHRPPPASSAPLLPGCGGTGLCPGRRGCCRATAPGPAPQPGWARPPARQRLPWGDGSRESLERPRHGKLPRPG